MANVGVYVRLDESRIAKLDRIAAAQKFGASRASVLTALAEQAVDAEADPVGGGGDTQARVTMDPRNRARQKGGK